MIEATYSAYGVIGTLVLTYFWKQMPWSKNYLTRNDCTFCSLHKEIIVVREVLLDLAVQAGLPVEKYRKLVK